MKKYNYEYIIEESKRGKKLTFIAFRIQKREDTLYTNIICEKECVYDEKHNDIFYTMEDMKKTIDWYEENKAVFIIEHLYTPKEIKK